MKRHLHNQFKREARLAKKRGEDVEKLNKIMQLLIEEKELSPKHKDHQLKGYLHKRRACHIAPDWILQYEIDTEGKEGKEITFCRLGSHSDLYK